MKKNKKQPLVLAMLLSCLGGGLFNDITMQAMEPITEGLTEQAKKMHRELAGKIKKLEGYDGIYVGAGYSAAGEPMFFAMEKLDDERVKVWQNYAEAIDRTGNIIGYLNELNNFCQDQEFRKKLTENGKFYRLRLMDTMCPNKPKLSQIFSKAGTRAGIKGFYEMLLRQKRGSIICVAYVSTKPIVGLFEPKIDLGNSPTLEEFEQAYNDLVISVGIDMERGTSRTEHRGITKNPFFEIYGSYKNIGMKLHGWAGTVEKEIFHKKYVTLYPTSSAAKLLHRSVKPGEMYIGIDTPPNYKSLKFYDYKMDYSDDEELELGKKFPPIKREFIGNAAAESKFGEPVHIFDLNVLSNYYTE